MSESNIEEFKLSEKHDVALVEKEKAAIENMNNNSMFHGNENSGKMRTFSFPKKARMNIQFDDVRYQVTEWPIKKVKCIDSLPAIPIPKPGMYNFWNISREKFGIEKKDAIAPSTICNSYNNNVIGHYLRCRDLGSVKR